MYTFISPTGKYVKTKTIREWANMYNIDFGTARGLACGYRKSHKGWTTTHPKARKVRKKFMTLLINVITQEQRVLGPSILQFAEQYGLQDQALGELINGHRICYKGWMLSSTHLQTKNAEKLITDTDF